MVTKKMKHKNEDGTVIEVDIGCEAYHVAQDTTHRFVSDAEKAKLENIEEQANHYILPAATSTVLGGIKIGNNLTNQNGKVHLTKENVIGALGYTPPKIDSTYEEATTSEAGLMSAADKTKVDAMDRIIDTKITNHNTSVTAHTDIRELISGLTRRFNALADSDDTTLDQLSEIVTYIKNNKSLIDSITTSKVNVSDIVDNVSSSSINKPLSARQGKILKDLIVSLTDLVTNKIDKVSGKGLSTNDYTTAEKNKLKEIAAGAEVNVQSDWNITDPNSDAYIKNKPTIPSDFKGSSENKAGEHGLVPAPSRGDGNRYLCSDGTWKIPPITGWASVGVIKIDRTITKTENGKTVVNTAAQTVGLPPGGFTEVCIKVNFSLDIIGTIYIPSAFLNMESAGMQHFRTGYFQNSENGGMASFAVDSHFIYLESLFLNSKDMINHSTDDIHFAVWYR